MQVQAINNTSFKATICNDYRSKVTNNIGKVIHTSKRNYWNSLIRESEIDRNKVQLDEAFAFLFNDDNSDVIFAATAPPNIPKVEAKTTTNGIIIVPAITLGVNK